MRFIQFLHLRERLEEEEGKGKKKKIPACGLILSTNPPQIFFSFRMSSQKKTRKKQKLGKKT